jgi:glucokinase
MTHPPVLLGIDFGGTKIATAVCDLAGNKLAAAVVDSLAERGARASFDHGVATATSLVAAHAAGAAIAAVGVATFGIPFEDRVELAPAIDGWERFALGRELRIAFPGAAIRMATDTKSAAYAEARWGALAGFDPAIYLNLGTGLAAAIVTGGRVLSGSQGAAGEIGYSLRQPGDVGRADGLRIPLEDMVSGQALQRRASLLRASSHSASPDGASADGASADGASADGASADGASADGASADGGSPDGRLLTAAEVFAAAASDRDLDDLISDFVDELAFHVVNLAIAVNPARIAVGGGITRSWDRIRPRLEEALLSGVPYPPELVLAHFPQEAPLLGAVALAVDAATADPAPAPVTTAPVTTAPSAPALTEPSSNGKKQTDISKGHYRDETHNAYQRPQGDLPAGASQATSYPADL